MKNKTLYLSLLGCVVTAFLFILVRYVWNGGNPSNRLGYGIFMSVTPALMALVLLKLTRRSSSWQWTAGVYALMFVLTSTIQFFGRMIPMN